MNRITLYAYLLKKNRFGSLVAFDILQNIIYTKILLTFGLVFVGYEKQAKLNTCFKTGHHCFKIWHWF